MLCKGLVTLSNFPSHLIARLSTVMNESTKMLIMSNDDNLPAAAFSQNNHLASSGWAEVLVAQWSGSFASESK
jgi:hypothetical protein